MTKFLNGVEVPWKPLSLQEFIDYDRLFQAQVYPPAQLEDEVFAKCCLDPSLVVNIDELDAGVVTTVVSQIMEASGPTYGPEQLAYDLNLARHLSNSFFDQGVAIICQVFPGYKPEDVYALDYRTYMLRLAQAERRMLEIGALGQPITVLSGEDEVDIPQAEQPRERPRPEPPKKRFADLNPTPPPPKQSNLHRIGSQDIAAGMEAYDSHDRNDFAITQHNERAKLLEGMEYIYPEYLQMVSRGEEITPEKIQQVKGADFKAVERKHEQYVQRLRDGTIKPEPPKPEEVKPKGKKKVVVRRVQ